VDFLPSFELISGVTHAILDEVPRMQSRRSVYPFGFFDTLRGKSATRAQSEILLLATLYPSLLAGRLTRMPSCPGIWGSFIFRISPVRSAECKPT
jgi:hypothetical protein